MQIFCRQEQLTNKTGCILCDVRILVPAKFRKQVLDTSHPEIVCMKSLACFHVWWPDIDTEIETLVHNCATC